MASKLTELEADELQKQGQDLYRQKKYQAALQRFNAILQQDRKPSLGALDSRSATHAKLGDLQAALRDGRRMIQEFKASCSGYLRTGQILQLLGKSDVALAIYNYGLRNVSASDPNKELIQGMCKKLLQRRSPSTTKDPLVVLPVEIMQIIFGYLNFRKMVSCLRVSQSWRSYLSSLPNLWSHLDFSTGTKALALSTAMTYIKHSRGKVTRASIQSLTVTNPVLKCIATRCKAMTYLEVHSNLNISLVESAPALGSLRHLVVAADISLDAISQILSLCGSLQKARFLSVYTKYPAKWNGDLSNLRSLSINLRRHNNDQANASLKLEYLIPMLNNIESLLVQGWSYGNYQITAPLDFSALRQLRHLDLAGLDAFLFPRLPESIQTLNISNWYYCAFSTPLSQNDMDNANLKSLSDFSVACSSDFLFSDLIKILQPNKGKLRTLNISGSTELEYSDLVKLITTGYLAEIVELNMACLPVDDRVAELMANELSSLRLLHIADTRITGVGLKSLVLKVGCKLERLNIKNCKSVNIDAVEWARDQGVTVDFTFSERELGKPRRVRLT